MLPIMKFSQADSDGGHLIQGYAPDHVIIDDHTYRGGLIVSPDRIITGWGPAEASALSAAHLDALIALAPQVIILGTGTRQVFPDPALYARVLEHGIGFEVMDTGAACRTYNILMSEGRRVAAALLLAD